MNRQLYEVHATRPAWVRDGSVSLIATHTDHHVSTLRIPDVTADMLAGGVGHKHIVGMPVMQDAAVALDYASGGAS